VGSANACVGKVQVRELMRILVFQSLSPELSSICERSLDNPVSIGSGTLNLLKFELGHLTPLSIKYHANYPLLPLMVVLVAVLAHGQVVLATCAAIPALLDL
jgi:hypothetical protein